MSSLITQTTQTSGQALLQKERPLSSRKQKSILLELNSRDRNYTIQVKSNPVHYTLASPMKDIRSVELIGGTIPAKPTNINSANNTFSISESGVSRTVTIPTGYYSDDAFLQQLSVLLSAGSQSTYVAQKNTLGNLVIVQSVFLQPFSLLFQSTPVRDVLDKLNGALLEQKTPALLMGFELSDYESSVNRIVSPYPMDLHANLTRLYLYMNFQNSLDLSCISRASGRRPPFAVIYLDTDTNGYKFLNKETLAPISPLLQPIGRLTTIQVEFRDEFFQLVDFNGKDFTLLLDCTVLE
jgi:hypothetical protein